MRFRVFPSALIVACAIQIAVSPIALAGPPTWLVVGDSWGFALGPVQEQKLVDIGFPIPVTNLALPGSTAANYANDDFGLLSAAKGFLAATPPGDLTLVYVSLGGNDMLAGYSAEGNAVYDRIRSDLEFVVAELLAQKPNSLILLGGYDILQFDQSGFCLLFGLVLMDAFLPWDVNPLFLELGTVNDAIAASDPRVLSLNVYGAGQGRPGNPNVFAWSPEGYTAGGNDCIHLSAAGYDDFNDALFFELGLQLIGLP